MKLAISIIDRINTVPNNIGSEILSCKKVNRGARLSEFQACVMKGARDGEKSERK